MSNPIPPQCQPLADKVQDIQVEIQSLQIDLQNAAGSAKALIAQKINRLWRDLAVAQRELQQCLGLPPPPQPLDATFMGASTLITTNSNPMVRGPFTSALTIGCQFSPDRLQVTITSFAPISVGPFSTPLGSDTVTVAQTGGGFGSFTPATGEMAMPLVLLFHHSLMIPFYSLDSTLSLIMDTGSSTSPSGALTVSGSPMDAQGFIVLAGVGVFKDGYLDKNEASIVIAGQVSPHP